MSFTEHASIGKMPTIPDKLVLLLLIITRLQAAPTGRLEICPEHPYYFRDGDRHIVLVGVSDRELFYIWHNQKGFSWKK